MTQKPVFKRVLLKASGEALMGSQGFGIDVAVADRIASDIAEARAMGVEVGVVVGGGNIFRGVAVASKGGDRVTGDHMGMLGTVINALALATSLRKLSIDTVVLSAISMPEICESFSQRQALHHMAQGRVVIFAAARATPSSPPIRPLRCALPKSAQKRSSRVPRSMASIPRIRRRIRMRPASMR